MSTVKQHKHLDIIKPDVPNHWEKKTVDVLTMLSEAEHRKYNLKTAHIKGYESWSESLKNQLRDMENKANQLHGKIDDITIADYPGLSGLVTNNRTKLNNVTKEVETLTKKVQKLPEPGYQDAEAFIKLEYADRDIDITSYMNPKAKNNIEVAKHPTDKYKLIIKINDMPGLYKITYGQEIIEGTRTSTNTTIKFDNGYEDLFGNSGNMLNHAVEFKGDKIPQRSEFFIRLPDNDEGNTITVYNTTVLQKYKASIYLHRISS